MRPRFRTRSCHRSKIFNTYQPSFIWCVTGTPASTSLMNLEKQARILGHWNEGLCLECGSNAGVR